MRKQPTTSQRAALLRALPTPIIAALLPALLSLTMQTSEAGSSWNMTANGPSPDPIFTDATAAAGLSTAPGFPFGDPIWGDFDNDGNIDLFVDNHFYAAPYLYQNNGNGTFTDIVPGSGINTEGDKHGSSWADYDNDGDLDLYITKGAKGGTILGQKKDELYDNLGAGQFRNIARKADVTDTWGKGRGVAWADYDKDGYLDLLDANLKTNMVLYKNNGDGTFIDVAAQAGLGDLQYIECVFADYNNDGFPDIFCTVAQADNSLGDLLFKNNGDGTFTDVSSQAGISPLTNGRSICAGDYDNDGDLDFFVSRGLDNGPLKQTLYRNNGDGTFTDVTDQAGLGATSNNRAAAWGDFDNDGYLDLYVVNSGIDPDGKGPNYLYKNNGNGSFTDVAASVGVDDLVASRGRGAAWADYDHDGFLDLFVTNGEDGTDFISGPQFLYHNGRNRNHWLEVKLVGTTSNRQALGTKVTIKTGRAIQYRELNGADEHYLSQGAAPLHFGLGRVKRVNQIIIKWPSGLSKKLTNVLADQQIVVTEGE